MTDDPKMWIGTPGEDDWREVGTVEEFKADAVLDDPVTFEPYDPDAMILPAKDKVTVTTKLSGINFDALAKAIGSVTSAMEQFHRSVMVIGTRSVAHQHPGYLEHPQTRVEHTRARKLYSERLRRDRRRLRKGRKPILRSGPDVRTLFPRVEMHDVQQHGDALGMKMIASPHLDSGQVVVADTGLLDRVFAEKPVLQFRETKHGYIRDPRWMGYTPSGYFVDEARNLTLGDIS